MRMYRVFILESLSYLLHTYIVTFDVCRVRSTVDQTSALAE